MKLTDRTADAVPHAEWMSSLPAERRAAIEAKAEAIAETLEKPKRRGRPPKDKTIGSDAGAAAGGQNEGELQAVSAPGGDPTADMVLAIRSLQRRRVFVIKELTRNNNATLAFTRQFYGFRTDMDEKARKAIVTRAAALVSAIVEDKPIAPEDEAVAAEVRSTILAAKAARAPLEAMRASTERDMEKLAKRLPVWSAWAEGVRGFGAKGLAVIVAEAGDPIGEYRTVSGLWKRLGLAMVDGRRQGDPGPGATADDWIRHGYNKARRAEMHAVIAEPLLKAQSQRVDDETGEVLRAAGPFREDYDRKRAEYDARTEATVDEPAMVGGRPNPAKWTPKRAHMAAMRYMTKRLVMDLYVEWRRAAGSNAETDKPSPIDAMAEAA